jgi:hypothetical protein
MPRNSTSERQKSGVLGAVADDTGGGWGRSVGRVAWPNVSTVGGPWLASCRCGMSAASSGLDSWRGWPLPGSLLLDLPSNTR